MPACVNPLVPYPWSARVYATQEKDGRPALTLSAGFRKEFGSCECLLRCLQCGYEFNEFLGDEAECQRGVKVIETT